VYASVVCVFVSLVANDNVVDWYVDQFDHEPNEAHCQEANGCGECNLLEL
jgi:hypothetical protein